MVYLYAVACLLLLSQPLLAATLVVDQDHPRCSDAPSGDRPYCSVAAAFGDLRAGDTVRIRASQRPYRVSVVSEQPGPITVEADGEQSPVLTRGSSEAIIYLIDASQWTIRHLTFDGEGEEVRYAIRVDARSRDVRHIRIEQNRFVNLGGFTGELKKPTAVRFSTPGWNKKRPEQNDYAVADSTIVGNVFDYCAHGGIEVSHTRNVTIADNRLTGFRCGRYNDGRVGVQAIKISQSSQGAVIRGNRVGAFQPSASCPVKLEKNRKSGKLSRGVYIGIYCDTGPEKGLVADNVVFDIDAGRLKPGPERRGASTGIYLESRCADWTVANNLIYNTGSYGLRIGSRPTGAARRIAVTNNTIDGVAGHAISIPKGENLTIQRNIFSNYGGVAIDFRNFAQCRRSWRKCKFTRKSRAFHQTNHHIDHNLFWQGGQDGSVAIWFNRKTKLTLSEWRRKSGGYDGQSIYADPAFVDAAKGQFELRASSPANQNADGAAWGYRAPQAK